MREALLVPLALGTLLLGWAQAQVPRFTFAASNYHPPADQATILQSPGLDEGGFISKLLLKPLRPRPPPAGPQATHSGQLCTSLSSYTEQEGALACGARPERLFCAWRACLHALHHHMNISSLYTSYIIYGNEASSLVLRRRYLTHCMGPRSLLCFQGSEMGLTFVLVTGAA